MARKPYQTKTGATRYKAVATAAEINDHTLGFCLACGEPADGVEPDARRYTCDSCGEAMVYGLEELLIMGLLELAGKD